MQNVQKNILIVDDDPQLRLALTHILKREGHAVDQAENGLRALQSIEAHVSGYDLVLMDIIMPDQEGIETILTLRKDKPDLKIIAMSGGARRHMFDPLKLATDCGANFVLAKPFEPEALRQMVRLCLV